MPDSVTVKLAIAAVGGVEVAITNAGPDQWTVGVPGSDLAFAVDGWDNAVAATDEFAQKLAALDAAKTTVAVALQDAKDYVAAKAELIKGP